MIRIVRDRANDYQEYFKDESEMKHSVGTLWEPVKLLEDLKNELKNE